MSQPRTAEPFAATAAATAAAASEGNHIVTPAAAPPINARLYRHALESVLGWLTLSELARAMATSQEWRAAVGTMHAAQTTLRLTEDSVGPFLRSPPSPLLERHVSAVEDPVEGFLFLSFKHLSGLATRLPHLRSLRTVLFSQRGGSAPNDEPCFPSCLERLELDVINGDAKHHDAIWLQLQRLEHLHTLILQAYATPLLVSAVAALPALREMSYDLSAEEDVAVLRALPWLERVTIPHGLAANVVALLSSPPPLQWRSFSLPRCSLTDGATACLANLPLLRQLDINISGLVDLSFLASLPALCELTLRGFGAARGVYTQEGWTMLVKSFTAAATPDGPVGAERGPCRLTKLSLHTTAYCSSGELRSMLSVMPLLRYLHLVDLESVSSLDFLTATHSLTELRLHAEDRRWLLPCIELQSLRVRALQQLQRLELTGVVQLSDVECAVYHQWPNARWPRLVAFSYKAATSEQLNREGIV
jgi:hypothetical protein